MQLPRITSVPTLPIAIPSGRRAARRSAEFLSRSQPVTNAVDNSPRRQPLSLPSTPQLEAANASDAPIAMQIALSATRLPPTHPTKIAANALALTRSFDSAPEDLDRDPAKYHSPLSGHLHAYQALNARLLQRVAQEPRIKGFGYWLHDMCNARIKSPKTQRPHAENLVRRLFELVEALYLCAETDADTVVDVGCDITKRQDPATMVLRSSDIAVINNRTRAVRHIEVTSVGVPVRSTYEINRAIKHVVDKMTDSTGTLEGAIAIEWAEEALPEQILGEVLGLLNDKQAAEPWNTARRVLDRIVLLRYDPQNADALAIFTRERPVAGAKPSDQTWHATQGPFLRLTDVLPPPPRDAFSNLDVEGLAREFAKPAPVVAQHRAPGHRKPRKV